MSRFRRASIQLAVAGFALAGTATLAVALGARINTTPSIPVGLYWKTGALAGRGAYVMFCPPVSDAFRAVKDRGYIGPGPCPGRYGYFMKKTLAAKDDRVAIDASGVRINGIPVPHSSPLPADKAGRPLSPFDIDRVLSADELLPMADDNPNSFDGRYLGPIPRSQVVAVIVPIFTW